MNESDTRLHKIDPALKAAGWNAVDDSKITTEYVFTRGKISQTVKAKQLKADYILIYKNVKLAVVEAKSDELDVSEGVMQAKEYADRLKIRFTYATNGNEIYEIDMETGNEALVASYPSPEELWQRTFGNAEEWRDKFNEMPFYSDGTRQPRYYQEIAINKVLSAIASGKNRILLTLATGTGKTFIAFQIAWKLFHSKWNVAKSYNRPRILFLADRNTLANQAFNSFEAFGDACVRIKPDSIRKNDGVPTNGSIFFTIFQTFTSGDGETGYFGDYPKDFFDLIIIDECHRGGAKDESTWRKILEYFDSAVQLGLTATPRRDINADTYKYFDEPVYEYSLKQGINDGFLTPFRHVKMIGNIDDYIFSPEDEVLSGEVDEGRTYEEDDFYQGRIYIRQRDEARVKEFLQYLRPNEKTIVFCSTQSHAGQIRDMINAQHKGNPKYAVRVAANDGEQGEQYLREFQDNEKTIPTILTTSKKLSTGVDALNVRNIVLLRPIKSMIEFKQIIGRGTRLYDGKYYFTIYDFVKAYEKFSDPTWDGEPVCSKCGNNPCTCKPKPPKSYIHDGDDDPKTPVGGEPVTPTVKPEKLVIRLSDGRTRKIRFLRDDMFWGADGKPVSAEEFIEELFGRMPDFFSDLDDLQHQWAIPKTREQLLAKMGEAGYGVEILSQIRSLIDADDCDLLDVLEYIGFNTTPIERAQRASNIKDYVDALPQTEQQFINYIIDAYIKHGIEELKNDKLPQLMQLKFGSVPEGIEALGGIEKARQAFLNFQSHLYLQ